MKAQQPDHEKRLKESILAYRVPFEEQAWDAMDALLDGEAGKKAPAEPPAPQGTPMRSTKYRRFFIFLFLLSAVVVFSAKQGVNLLEKTKAPASSSTPSNKMKNGAQDTALSSGLTSATTADENTVENPTTTPATTVAERTFNQSTTTPAATQNGQKANLRESSLGNSGSTTRKRATNPNRGWAVGRIKPASSANNFKGGNTSFTPGNIAGSNSGLTAAAPQNNAVPETSTGLIVADSMLNEPMKSLDNLAFLPLLPLDSLNSARDLPAAEAVPVKNKTRRNLQRGWVLGGNLGIVDYQPLYFSVRPVVGYHVAFPMQNGYVQTGLLVTGAKGYNQRANFEYSSPGGNLQIEVSLNNLVFLEVPLVYQRAFTGDKRQFWLAGIRTAVVLPVNNFVSNAGTILPNNSIFPNANIDLYDGVRWFDLGLTLGWQWRFSERWAIDVRYTQGLMDLTHDNFFNNTETTLNSDLQLTFRHYVSTFK